MELLEKLEQELNITYPKIYKELYASKMLDWGSASANWYEQTFPKLKKNPPLLLFAQDIEIWDPIAFQGGIAEVMNQEVYAIDHNYQLVPFAKNGAGDLFVFQYDLQQAEDIPISFIPHDDDQATVLAANLQDFIFRLLLEALTDIDSDSMVYEKHHKDIKENLRAQLHTHRPFLKDSQIKVLEDLYQKDIFKYTCKMPNGSCYECEGLLRYDQADQILKREIDFAHFNFTFKYADN